MPIERLKSQSGFWASKFRIDCLYGGGGGLINTGREGLFSSFCSFWLRAPDGAVIEMELTSALRRMIKRTRSNMDGQMKVPRQANWGVSEI